MTRSTAPLLRVLFGWLAVLLALAPLAAPVVAAQADGTVMLGARIVGDNKRVRFVADLSRKVDSVVFTLSDPYRVIVDLPEVRFALPELAGSSGRGLISAFRYGAISAGKSRIVMDLSGPALIDRTFIVDPADGQPARLVIDVIPTDREQFLAATRKYKEQQTASVDTGSGAGASGGSGDLPLVVVDPGHGGIDAGAHGGNGAVEKDVTLAFGKVLGAKLEASGRYRVLYTRDDDTFVALGERVHIARKNDADLFVSIHANSFRGQSVRGAIIYTASDEATDKMAATLAETENQSDALAGIDVDAEDAGDVKDILIDLTKRETRNFGVVFARNLVKELGKTTRMFKVPHQEAGFKVLEAPDVPSALIELGYLTNAADAKLMVTEEWQEKAAGSVVRAIDTYFGKRIAGRESN